MVSTLVRPADRPNASIEPAPSRPATPVRPLRVGVFVSEFPALSETFVLRQVVGLLDRGHDVTVFADRPRSEPLVPPDFERYDLRARTRYIGMPELRLARVPAALRLLARRAGGREMALLRSFDPFRYGRHAANLRALFWTLRLVDEPPFDILHCHFGPVGELVATLRDAGAVAGRLVTTFHGADLTTYRFGRAEAYRRLRRGGDLFLPISDYLARRLAALGFPDERIAVHRMGVDTGRFAARDGTVGGQEVLRVLSIGRLVAKKGFADALRAVAMARQAGAPVAYTIIGDGPLRSDLEYVADRLGIADAVEFRGWQVHDAVVEAIDTHDVLLAPSVTGPDGDQEGIPVTLMEAMATGMPVVSTEHSGIPELVEHGVGGLLAPEGDFDALGEALCRLAGAPEQASAMGRAARRRVEEHFDSNALDDRLDRLLRAAATA